jgi:hypothetical protein
VSVTVTPNHPPVAPDMSVSTPSNQRFGSSVTYYASDADSDALSPVVDDQPQHGSMTMNGYGSFSYKAEKSYSGPDSFTYHLNDGYEDSAQATVHITVLASFNRAPRADPTEYWFNPGKTGTIQVWWHAGDPDEDPIGAEVVTQPAVGRLWVDGGTLRYTPPANYLGTTTATYRVSDGELWSPPATVTLNVIPPIIWPADPAASSTSKSKVKAGGAIQPFANLFVDHAAIRGRRLTLRAGISRLATGTVKVSFSAAGATTRGTARIVKGAIAVSLPLAGRQRHSRTGVVTLTYGGNSAVRPERVRVAAAPAASRLRVTQARIAASGRLALAGSISRRAHGVLQVRLTYSPRAGKTKEYDYKARIRGGGWSLGDVLPAEAAKTRVQVTVMYAGDGARGIGGAHISQEVGP